MRLLLTAAEDRFQESASKAAVLTESLWQQHLNSQPRALLASLYNLAPLIGDYQEGIFGGACERLRVCLFVCVVSLCVASVRVLQRIALVCCLQAVAAE